MISMEFPLFSVSVKPDFRVHKPYGNEKGWIKVIPSAAYGAANIFDRDILIYCMSQLIASANQGEQLSPLMLINTHEMLASTNRRTAGTGYQALADAIRRLHGTRIETNIQMPGYGMEAGIGFLNGYQLWNQNDKNDPHNVRKYDVDGLVLELHEWVFQSVKSNKVLTFSRDYFKLRKPLERRLYELARKHCGDQSKWLIGWDTLKMKCGSQASMKEFRRMIRNIIEADAEYDHMPQYRFEYDDRNIYVYPKADLTPVIAPRPISYIALSEESYQAARQVAPGWDVYVLENEWRAWMANDTKRASPKSPDKAFIGFCKAFHERRQSHQGALFYDGE